MTADAMKERAIGATVLDDGPFPLREHPTSNGDVGKVLRWPTSDAEPDLRNISPMPEHIIEQLADLWCEVLLESLNRHPVHAEPDAA